MTLVIADHTGFGNWTSLEKYNDQFEARMASWPVPSLVREVKGTWLADLLDTTFSTGNITFGVADNGKLPAGPVKAKGTFSELPDRRILSSRKWWMRIFILVPGICR
ncbi:MAG TPA: hypothetical protein VK722_06435 [Candidatus Aquilonibacter sp.]|nr:hypothetical protein [Candidatus Aquilonibacter sp.]